jgi:hypothetical protein
VFDGIMHRYRDTNPAPGQLGHFGPAWRDVALSRKGFGQLDAAGNIVEKPFPGAPPDVLAQGLNPNFPTFVANPLRAPDAGDLVPLAQMIQTGVDVSWLRRHHYTPNDDQKWGVGDFPDGDTSDPLVDDVREAGFGDDVLTAESTMGRLLTDESRSPLFSETYDAPFYNGERNPAMMYQPMSRMENLVTNRSNVFAVWITVGYFEVERAPDWNDPNLATRTAIRARFNDDINLYNRVYPEGYMLGRELGSDTGDTTRHRGFYIIDRSAEVGFKPGQDLNAEKAILLRRRID